MYITSTGMVCPVGLSAEAACAAMRAGIAQFEELPYLDNDGEPIVGTMTPGLDADLKFEHRLVEMLAAAILDCLKGKLSTPLATIPLLVGLPESGRPGVQDVLADRIIGLVQEKLQVQFHPELSRTIQKGHTAGFEGLRTARELFEDAKISACLICGVDSYINARSLLWLDDHFRLKTEQNSDGVIPGEAAAAILVRCSSEKPTSGAIRVAGSGFDNEKVNICSDEPLLGLGLAEAAQRALSDAGLLMHQVDFRISDSTGESYGFREHSLALARVMRIVRKEFPIWHFADSIGDTGAAAGLCQLVVAYHAFINEYSPGRKAICFTSATPGDRAVAVLQHAAQ